MLRETHYVQPKLASGARRSIPTAAIWLAGSLLFSWFALNFGSFAESYGA